MGTTAQKLSYLKETKKQILEKVNNIDGTITNDTTFRQGTQKVVDVYNYYNNESESLTPQQTTGKVNYLKETKRLYKDAMNLFDENITNQTTFREYSDKLDDMYNNLPKVEMEGSNFQLQDTKAGKLLLTPKGNTKQETTNGYNLINLDNGTKTDRGITGTITEHSILSWEGAAISSYANITYEQNINLPIGTYTFSIDKVTPNNERVVIYLRGATTQSVVIQRGRTFVTVTTTEEKTVYWVGISNLVADNNYNGEVKLMFESGSVAHDYEPYTGGIASPNPDYPQDIKVVTGENIVNIRGLSLFDDTKFAKVNPSQSVTPTFKDGKVIINGTAGSGGSDIRIESSTPFLTLKAGTYTFLFNEATTNWNCELNINALHYGNYKLVKGMNTNKRILVITLDSDLDIYNLNIHFRPNITFTNQELWLMILEGEYTAENAPDFEPYIEPIEKELNLTSKNLFDGSWESGSISDATGSDETNNRVIRSTNYISVKPSTEYTVSAENNISIFVYYYDKNKNYISFNNTQVTPKTFTTPVNAYYVRIRTRQSEDITDTSLKCQVEPGSTATDYEPYYNLELAKIGDYSDLIFKNEKTNPYYDNTLIENGWYIEKNIGKVVLNGSEDIDRQNTQTLSAYRFTIGISETNIIKVNDGTAENPIKSDNFTAINRNKTYEQVDGICYGMSTNDIYKDFIIYYDDTKNMTTDQFKTWLSTHNTTVYYVLATPTDIQITDTTLINQLEEINSIIGTGGTVVIKTQSGSNNAPLIVNAKALQKI